MIFLKIFMPMLTAHTIKILQSLDKKKFRQKYNLFLVEGDKIIRELKNSSYKVQEIFSTDISNPDFQSFKTNLITERELRKISLLQNPKNSVAVCELRENTSIEAPIQLVLDNVQDPGNLGTIIRIADWFGIKHIFCSMDTADCWNPKVVQATMGSIARVTMHYLDLGRLIDLLPKSYPIYGTLLDGNDIYAEKLSAAGLIVMGNEGNGISAAIRERINRRLLIPNFSTEATHAESLNVAIATAIVCSEFRRRGTVEP